MQNTNHLQSPIKDTATSRFSSKSTQSQSSSRHETKAEKDIVEFQSKLQFNSDPLLDDTDGLRRSVPSIHIDQVNQDRARERPARGVRARSSCLKEEPLMTLPEISSAVSSSDHHVDTTDVKNCLKRHELLLIKDPLYKQQYMLHIERKERKERILTDFLKVQQSIDEQLKATQSEHRSEQVCSRSVNSVIQQYNVANASIDAACRKHIEEIDRQEHAANHKRQLIAKRMGYKPETVEQVSHRLLKKEGERNLKKDFISRPVRPQAKAPQKIFVAGTKTKSYNMRIEPAMANKKRATSRADGAEATAQKPADGLMLPAVIQNDMVQSVSTPASSISPKSKLVKEAVLTAMSRRQAYTNALSVNSSSSEGGFHCEL